MISRRDFGKAIGTLAVAGSAGTFARVGPEERRKLVPGPDGVTVLALGGVPGAFESGA